MKHKQYSVEQIVAALKQAAPDMPVSQMTTPADVVVFTSCRLDHRRPDPYANFPKRPL